jgi:hypothetical protein
MTLSQRSVLARPKPGWSYAARVENDECGGRHAHILAQVALSLDVIPNTSGLRAHVTINISTIIKGGIW